jgi:hypothetical protein
MIAWSSQDDRLVRSTKDKVSTLSIPAVPRAEQTYHAIRQAASFLCGGNTHEDDAMRRLEALHDKGRRFGGQDFSAAVLFASLERAGQFDAAARIRDRYLRSGRREQYPVPKSLLGLSC